TLDEIYEASQSITEKANEDASIIWGAVINDNMDDEISVTVIATGFDSNNLGAQSAKTKEPETQAATAEEKKPEKKAERTSRVIDEDDDFYNIMSIFNK
ncbi:MAG TPA: cell division protein FtsZ, partial [Candidatus Limousia pullorum]|nr:cell division protein FtsZ [Candidatus Limousia pullorum]